MISIAMIATVRPKIVEATLKSLRKNIRYYGILRLVADIGPIGEKNHTQEDVKKIMTAYFPIATLINTPEKPGQPRAQKWVWENTTTDLVLQWEDDWILEGELDLDRLQINMREGIGQICFDRTNKLLTQKESFRKQFRPWRGRLWERLESKSIVVTPALLSQKYLRDILPLVSETENTDIISDRPQIQEVLSRWKTLLLAAPPAVRDTGKEWMAQHGLKRNKRSAAFWEPLR